MLVFQAIVDTGIEFVVLAAIFSVRFGYAVADFDLLAIDNRALVGP
ncbi:hypothetical protein [Agrobacterium tumefaciens]|nr:hypothetical protein [Agrobacterium tumefaciens]